MQIDYKAVFDCAPTAKSILAIDRPKFTILAANDQYFKETGTDKSIIGKGLFEVFPDNPDSGQGGSRSVYIHMLEAIMTRKTVLSGVTRYDLPDENGNMQARYWTSETTPIIKDGQVIYLLQGALDITHLVKKGLDY